MSISLLTQSINIPDNIAGWKMLQNDPVSQFKQFTSDPVLKSQIAYFEANVGKATTVQKLLADPRLQDVAFTAYGLTAQIGANGLMKQVFNSNLSDPNSTANRLTDQAYKQIAKAFGYTNASTAAVPATPSTASVGLDDFTNTNSFSTFSGTFAGVTLQNVNLSGDTSRDQIAATLNQAFQNADGGRSDITVKVSGLSLQFTDAKGRGTATSFDWTTDGSDDIEPTATAPTNLVAGSQAVAATGGPNVTSASFVQSMVQKYTEAQFQNVIGNTSPTLQNALYAQQNLSSITNWYSVIADTKLATVVEGALGLPTSFQTLDVDVQAKDLAARMNVKDFQNPSKVTALLNKYVAIGTAQEQAQSSSANSIVSLYANISGGYSSGYSSGSAAALLLST